MDALANQLVKTRYMDTGLVAVLAEALPQELREEAAARNVNILFYKDLAEFADIPKPTHEAIEAQFNTIGLDNWALVRLSQRHLAAKDLAAAENAARLAAKRVTGNPAVLAHLSDVLRLRGDHAGALEILLDAVKIHPQNAWCHFRLSRIYLEKGNIDAAKEAAQIAARLEPKDDFLCRHLSQVLGKVEESRT
jgi:tetratricopeptide (TPR) repeat protein